MSERELCGEPAQRIDAFWLAFRQIENDLIRQPVLDQVERVNGDLEHQFKDLALEMVGSDGDECIKLIASAHGNTESFPLLLEFVRRAPPLRHYTLSAFRTRTESPDFPIRMDDFELATTDVVIGHFADAGQVGLEIVFARELPVDVIDHARHIAFIMLDHVLGEYDFAVKVGPVDFVEAFSDAVVQTTSLDQFGAVFDRFWADTLGHTGAFPSGEHKWTLLTIDFDDEQGKDRAIVAVNDSANSIAARSDLGHLVCLRFHTPDSVALDLAREIQEQIAGRLEMRHEGILSHTMVRQGWRQANYYVGDVSVVRGLVEQSLRGSAHVEHELDDEFDPSWSKYFDFACR